MFVFTNIIDAVAVILSMLISAYILVIVVACVVSWFNVNPWHPAVRVLRQLTEPVFDIVRRKIPFSRVGNVDLSPLIVFIALEFIDLVVVRSLRQLAMGI